MQYKVGRVKNYKGGVGNIITKEKKINKINLVYSK